MLAGALLIAIGMGLLLLVALRPGGGGLAPRPMIVWGGLVFPALVLTALVAAAFLLGERALPRGDALRIEAVSRQFSWEFRYPNGASTRDLLHIPAGRPVEFAVTSEDVVHAFWIPRLGGKIDAIPGHRNLVRLSADRPGRYRGICAEFCGDGHAVMRFSVEAHAPAEYEAVLSGLRGGSR
jgi:cytochrome c oxidase subunit 2